MSNLGSVSKPIVIRASRDTLALVAAASAMTFAMAYAVHNKHDRLPAPTPEAAAPAQATQQPWAGHLAELAPTAVSAPSERMSSAALVVPKAQLALPPVSRSPAKRPCLEAACPPVAKAAPASSPAAVRRMAAETTDRSEAHQHPRRTLLGMLNPLNHLPSMSAVGRPFSYASSTVAGWFKRL